jgi:NAD+ kinase
MKKVLLYPNPERDIDLSATSEAAHILYKAGIQVCVSGNHPAYEGLPDFIGVCTFEEALVEANMVICLGGDGTKLHIARSAALAGIPILGINFGKKGFMAELERDEIWCLNQIVEGKYFLDNRMMMDVSVLENGSFVFTGVALNDAVITNGIIAHMLNLTVKADNRKVFSFPGDGVIFSTPTGSTAYSLSAGGPIVEPSAENIIITPICAHSLHARAYVLNSDHVISADLSDLQNKTAYLSVDGGQPLPLLHTYELRIKRSESKTRLVRIKERSFYDIINKKLVTDRVL